MVTVMAQQSPNGPDVVALPSAVTGAVGTLAVMA
jgi:hypothetical protein